MNCKALFGSNYIFEEYSKLKNPKVDKKTFIEIFEDFATLVLKDVIEQGKDYMLPSKLGSLRVKKRMLNFKFKDTGDINLRSTGCGVDWGSTRKMWKEYPETKEQKKVLYYTNNHSGNWKYSFVWNRYLHDLGRNIDCYSLVLNRLTGKRYLTKIVKQGKQPEYYL